MANKKLKFPKPKKITIIQQVSSIRTRFPDFSCDYTSTSLTCSGRIQPTPRSSTYDMELNYELGLFPKVFILNLDEKDKSVLRNTHRYSDGRLCLFLPSTNEWNAQKFISFSIIPWTVEWLYFYEMWKITKVWYGEGVHIVKEDNEHK